MRKINLCKIAAVMVISLSVLVGCGSDDGATTTTKAESQTDNNTAKGYVFKHDGVEVVIDMEAADIIEALGEPQSYFEAASCAFEGLDKMYTYGSFEVDTYELNGVDHISCVILKDDMVKTPEGVGLFMTKDDMISAYGENYTEKQGSYVYKKDGMELVFIITGDEIQSITYRTTAF